MSEYDRLSESAETRVHGFHLVSVPRVLSFFALASAAAMTANVPDAVAELPLEPARQLEFDVSEGTWLSLDISSDGTTLIFDLLGDIYTLPIDGGNASPLLRGPAFDSQPVYSPDATKIAFVSDRSGAENVWVVNADGSAPSQLSDDRDKAMYSSPSWASDGSAVYVSRRTEADGVFEIWLHHVDGGAGVRITKGSAGPEQRRDERWNALGAALSPDGRWLFYARKNNEQWDADTNPLWSIVRHDLRDGRTLPVVDGPASAMRPRLSPDGRLLVYGARRDRQTGLRLRDLQTGDDRWLVIPVERDAQDGSYSRDTLPGYAFTPDGEALIVSIKGRPHRVDIASGRSQSLPFAAHVELDVGPWLPRQTGVEEGAVRARVIQAPRLSPDGETIAFSALGQIYVMSLSDRKPRALTERGEAAFQPSWSPDGDWIAYVTWDAVKGGRVMRMREDGGRQQQLTESAAFYTDPVHAPAGDRVFALRSSHYDRLRRVEEVSNNRAADLVSIPASGGDVELVSHLESGAQRPYFTNDQERIFLTTSEGVVSMRIDGADRRLHAKIEGAFPWNHRHEQPVPVEEILLSPDRRWALTRSADQLHLLRVPPATGEPVVLDLLADALTPYRQVSKIGADYFGWADDGRSITWSLGSTFSRRAFGGTGNPGEPQSFEVVVEVPRDEPEGALLLHGATAITMRGDEIIENADILVTGNRITAIGARGTVDVPANAEVRNLDRHYVIPGFVDTHAHWYEIRRDVLDLQSWTFLANLAFGVTAGLDVQGMDQDAFVYQDLIDAGLMIGPRAWTVGRGMFSDNVIESPEDARILLRRYRDFYRTRNVKSYAIGNREKRQWVVEASADLGMMPTTEGMGDLKLDITHAIDGFAGNEHYFPEPLYADVIELFGRTRIGYTPTLMITSGGPAAEDVFFAEKSWHDDLKLKRFMPHAVIDARTSPRHWLRREEHVYPRVAADARRIMQAGGRVGIGSHAELQGVAYHWEMQALATGGWTPREILEAATIGGSEIIGRADAIGSLEAGKYADLLILAENPLDDISHTQSLRYVMKNGRLYDAGTLDEVWPRRRPLPALWFDGEPPAALQGLQQER